MSLGCSQLQTLGGFISYKLKSNKPKGKEILKEKTCWELNLLFLFQGRNGEIRYSLRNTGAVPEQALAYFYVDPYTGTLSITQPLTNDLDQPDNYRVIRCLHSLYLH